YSITAESRVRLLDRECMSRTDRIAAAAVVVAVALTLTALPRSSAQMCAGDCNGDGNVAIAEGITGDDITVGNRHIGDRAALDPNGDGGVSVDELVGGVNDALNGCLAPTVSPAPTPAVAESVLEHHHTPDRNGVYVIPELTTAHAATLAIDPTFAPTIDGQT